jgi:hypothetical protein
VLAHVSCKALGKANCEDVDVVDKSEIIYNLEKMTANEVSWQSSTQGKNFRFTNSADSQSWGLLGLVMSI